jgi:signal transduction histidine kinase
MLDPAVPRRDITATGALAALALTAAVLLSGVNEPLLLAGFLLLAACLGILANGRQGMRAAPRRAPDALPYPGLFNRIPDPMFIVALREDGSIGTIERANAAACGATGMTNDVLLSGTVADVFPDLPEQLQRTLVRLVDERGSVTREQTLRGSDGVGRQVQAEFYTLDAERGKRMLILVKDLGDRAAAERVIGRRERQLAQLSSVTRSINEVLETETILQRVVAATMALVGATAGMAGLRQNDVIVFPEYTDMDGPHPIDLRLAIGEGVAGAVWKTSSPVLTNDAPREAPRSSAEADRFQPTSLIAVPILDHDGGLLGCLEVHDKADGRPFDHEDLLVTFGVASSAAIAIENARRVGELVSTRRELLQHRERLQRLASELSRTEERERRRIAEELHDRIGQELAVLRIQLGQLGSEHPACATVITELRELVEQTIADTRSLTFEISPPMLYALGLAPTVEWLCEQMERQHGIRMSVSQDIGGRRVTDDARALLYISIRELLMNVVKHAKASSAEVSIAAVGEWLWVRVTDDGVGFSAEEGGMRTDAFGLFTVQERLLSLGGSMSISSAPGKGSEVVLKVPLEPLD